MFPERSLNSTRTCGVRKYLVGELNSPVVEWPDRGLMDNSRQRHFFGVREYRRGIEFSSGGVA
eukprot:1185395-Prorocentrum_minimum.AAC.1